MDKTSSFSIKIKSMEWNCFWYETEEEGKKHKEMCTKIQNNLVKYGEKNFQICGILHTDLY